jgi:hypothetical protein
VAVERFVWTDHALLRLDERHLTQSDVEQAIREGHRGRQVNDGQADWLIEGLTAHGSVLKPYTTIPPGMTRRQRASCQHGGWTKWPGA